MNRRPSNVAIRRIASLAALATLWATFASAGVYKIDKSHSEAGFKIRHFLSKSSGRFDDFSGTIDLDEQDPTKSTVSFMIKAASIDTDNSSRDEQLRSEDFFWVDKYPEIIFMSTKITKTGKNTYDVTGNLTMRGVTKPITLPVTFLGTMHDPWGGVRAGFEAAITINRKDWGINWNKALDQGGYMLSDDVDISISIDAVEEK